MAVTKETTVRSAHDQVTIEGTVIGTHRLGLGESMADGDGFYELTDDELGAIVAYAIEMKLAVRPRGKRAKAVVALGSAGPTGNVRRQLGAID